MSTDLTGPELATILREDLILYYRHLAGRVERAVQAIPHAKLWAKPYTYGNSVGHLVLHLTGSLNHYIGAQVGGIDYVRDRSHEFTSASRPTAEELLEQFREAIDLTCSTIASLDDEGLRAPVSDEPPIRSRLGLLLVSASHMNNHIGQMAYLVQAQGHHTWEPPLW